MSTFDSDDLEATGYFLPEDSQLRLKKLREYLEFLANLARPRRPDEHQEFTAEIRVGEVAICLELLEEQIGLVLDELSWPAERGERGAGWEEDDEPEDEEDEDAELDATDADDMEPEAIEADGAEPEPAEVGGKPDKRYVFGVTLDQIDEINHLLAMIRAHGDVVIASHDAEFASGTLSNLGDAIFRDAGKLRDIIIDVNNQELRPAGRRRTGVREEPAAYHALPAHLPMGVAPQTGAKAPVLH